MNTSNKHPSELWNALIGELHAEKKRSVTYKKIAEMSGMSETNLHRICKGTAKMGQMEGFLRLLKELPEERRNKIINEYLNT